MLPLTLKKVAIPMTHYMMALRPMQECAQNI